MNEIKSMEQMLAEDICDCSKILDHPWYTFDEKLKIYKRITSRYDNVIKDFGLGLFQYYAQEHFFDTDLDNDTLTHNLSILLEKMKIYQAQNFYKPSTNATKSITSKPSGNKVFIVHGHDDALKIEVARFLEKAGFESIILHEQSDHGKTIIEKIEEYTDVDFAIVLYTECDKGRNKNSPVDEEKYRARQNVVFEHGYLIAKLGRNKVCALVKGELELPSDISGIVYVNYDGTETWKLNILKNMNGAGLPVDMNKAFL